MRYSAILASPLPDVRLGIVIAGDELSEVHFLRHCREVLEPRPGSLMWLTATQLNAYFADPGYRFRLPLAERGTGFQLRVWSALQNISVGQTVTYGAMAAQLGTSARAIGQACRRNPLPILVPCHRVVAAHRISGYCGASTGYYPAIKSWLLDHESRA